MLRRLLDLVGLGSQDSAPEGQGGSEPPHVIWDGGQVALGHAGTDAPQAHRDEAAIHPSEHRSEGQGGHLDGTSERLPDYLSSILGTERVSTDLIHPDKQGLEPASAKELIAANKDLILQALGGFTNKSFISNFDEEIMEMIRRFAHWMGPFPASRAHHHTGRGGLFTHSLGVAVSALHMSVSRNVAFGSTPRERDADILAWQLICFIAGLIHDIGKLHTTARVHALAVGADPVGQGGFRSSAAPIYDHPWEPMVEGFEGWVQQNRVRSYYLNFDFKETMTHRDFTVRYIMALVPRALLAFIYHANPLISQQFEDFIRNPESSAKTPIFTVVHDADHLNVAQSMDPRRRPGSIELASLIYRRFGEFAAETTWNLPNSPFIYAHVQKVTADGAHFFGIPFFVATDLNIQAFHSFITARPMLGVGLKHEPIRSIMNALETSLVFHRTIEGILPEQAPDPELSDFIPASIAMIRFPAKQAELVIKSVDGNPQDAIMKLPVIPLKLRPTAAVMISPPTLSFTTLPKPLSAAVIQVEIDDGRITHADPALRNDAEAMKALNLAALADEEPSEEAREALLSAFPKARPSKQTAPADDRQSSLGLTADKPKTRRLSEQAASLAGIRLDHQRAMPTPRPTSARSEPVEPVTHKTAGNISAQDKDSPAWQRLYDTCNDHGTELSRQIAWATIWLMISEHPHNLCMAVNEGSGRYGLRTSNFGKSLRNTIMSIARSRGSDTSLIAEIYPASGVQLTDPSLAAIFTRETGSKTRTLYLNDDTARLVEPFLQYLVVPEAGSTRPAPESTQ